MRWNTPLFDAWRKAEWTPKHWPGWNKGKEKNTLTRVGLKPVTPGWKRLVLTWCYQCPVNIHTRLSDELQIQSTAIGYVKYNVLPMLCLHHYNRSIDGSGVVHVMCQWTYTPLLGVCVCYSLNIIFKNVWNTCIIIIVPQTTSYQGLIWTSSIFWTKEDCSDWWRMFSCFWTNCRVLTQL